jgi:hypothetical protein
MGALMDAFYRLGAAGRGRSMGVVEWNFNGGRLQGEEVKGRRRSSVRLLTWRRAARGTVAAVAGRWWRHGSWAVWARNVSQDEKLDGSL